MQYIEGIVAAIFGGISTLIVLVIQVRNNKLKPTAEKKELSELITDIHTSTVNSHGADMRSQLDKIELSIEYTQDIIKNNHTDILDIRERIYSLDKRISKIES